MYSFPDLEPVYCFMTSSNCCFLTCIQISQEVGKVVWYSHLLKIFPQFVVIHTVKVFGVVNKAEVGEGNGIPLHYSCLENPMDGGAWWAIVHGVAKSQTWLNDFTLTFHFHALEKQMATHSSVLTWRIPGIAEPGGLPSMGSYRVRHDWSDLAAAAVAADGTGLAPHIPSTWGTRLWLRTGKMSEEKNNLAVFFFFFPFSFSYFLKKFSPCSSPTPFSSLLPNEHETSLWIRQFHSKWGDL